MCPTVADEATAACTHFMHKVQTTGGGVQTQAGEGGEVGASVTYSKGLMQLMPAAHVRGGQEGGKC